MRRADSYVSCVSWALSCALLLSLSASLFLASPAAMASRGARGKLSLRMQKWLPVNAPFLLSMQPTKPSALRGFFSPQVARQLPCMAMDLVIRKSLRRMGRSQSFVVKCSAALSPQRIFFAPQATARSSLPQLWKYGALAPGTFRQGARALGVRYLSLLVPANTTPKMLGVWQALLKGYGLRVWRPASKGLPSGAVVLKRGRRSGSVALLIPRKGWVQVLLTLPPTRHQVQRGHSWHLYALQGLLMGLRQSQSQTPRMTAARAHFASSNSVISVYLHGQRALTWGVWSGLWQGLSALDSATHSQKASLFGAFSSIALLPKLLMSSPLADAEDAALSLRVQPHLAVDFVQSLTAAGKRGYQAARVKQVIAVKKGAYVADLSWRLNLRALLKQFPSSLPWIEHAVLRKPSPPTRKQARRRLSLFFQNCGVACPLGLVGMGPWYYMAGLQRLAPKSRMQALGASLGRFVVLAPTKATGTQAPKPRFALALRWTSGMAVAYASHLKRWKAQARQQGTKLYVRLTRSDKGQQFLLVGGNYEPALVFGAGKLKLQWQKGPLVQARARLSLLRRALQTLGALLGGRAGMRLRRVGVRLRSLAKASGLTKRRLQGVQARVLVKGHTLLAQLRLCRAGCAAWGEARVVSGSAAPLSLPKRWPPQGTALCYRQARAQTYRLAKLLSAHSREAAIREYTRQWKLMRRPLRCLVRGAKTGPLVPGFVRIWKAYMAEFTKFRLTIANGKLWQLRRFKRGLSFRKKPTLYPGHQGAGVSIVIQPKGLTIATDRYVLPRGCSLAARDMRKTPLSQRVTCPHQSGKPDVQCALRCIEKVGQFLPKSLFFYVLPSLQQRYKISLVKGMPSPLLRLLWDLQEAAHKRRRFYQLSLASAYHRMSGKPWWSYYKIKRKKRPKSGVGKINVKAVIALLRRKRSSIRFCYEQELRLNPALRGKLVLLTTIGLRGRATFIGVQSNTLNRNVALCAIKKLKRWRFPRPDGVPVKIAIPFIFQPSP